jgi:hypothetical protein
MQVAFKPLAVARHGKTGDEINGRDKELAFNEKLTPVGVTQSQLNRARQVVQAYDGRVWSTPQTVGIQIQAVNDAPHGLLFSGVLAIPEKRPGYVLGNLAVMDPDANEVFDYSVSDPRFEVVGNTLKVTDSAVIPYQAPGWIDLRFVARSRTNGDTIERPERIFIVKDPTPFHNDTTPRYDKAQAELSWERTVEFFNKYLG